MLFVKQIEIILSLSNYFATSIITSALKIICVCPMLMVEILGNCLLLIASYSSSMLSKVMLMA